MQIHRKSLHFIRMISDFGAVLVSFLVAAVLSEHVSVSQWGASYYLLVVSLIITLFFSARITGLNDEFRSRNFSFELIAVIKTTLVQAIAAIVCIFMLKKITLSRLFVLYYAGNLVFLLTLEKYVIRQPLQRLRMKGRNTRSMLIIGAGVVGYQFYEAIKLNKHFGYRVVGFLDDATKPFLNGSYLGPIDNLENVLETKTVDDVIIALPNYASEKVEWVLKTCENYPIRTRIIPDFFRFAPNKYSVSMFNKFPILSQRDDQINEIHWRLIKRVFDLFVTISVFILVFSWLWSMIIVMQKILNPGPIFFKALRWGRNGEEFYCYKFRSMVPHSKNVDHSAITGIQASATHALLHSVNSSSGAIWMNCRSS